MLRSVYLPAIYSLILLVLFIGDTSSLKADVQILKTKYHSISSLLENNHYAVPIYIESQNSKEHQQGDIYGIIYHPFNIVKQSLSLAVNWCDIAPQHLNIKACTYRKLNGSCQLRLYSGRKYFEVPEDTYMLEYLFNSKAQGTDFIQISLHADEGALGTSNYKIITKVIPLTNNSSFIHFSYSYKQNFWTRAAMSAYLATIGHDKVGFTIVDKDTNDNPLYIDGVRGVIERNAIRYYYAIQSYLDTLNVPEDNRLLARLNRWFELTENHHRQLYEMDKEDYLEYKLKEHTEQVRLQSNISHHQSDCPVSPSKQ